MPDKQPQEIVSEKELKGLLDKIFGRVATSRVYASFLTDPFPALARPSDKNKHRQKRHPEYIDLDPTYRALFVMYERILGMISAGTDKEDLFNTTYVTPTVPPEHKDLEAVRNPLYLDKPTLPANLSTRYIEHLIENLCGVARTVKNTTESIRAANMSRYFLVGYVGSGKSTFLNYAFSKYGAWMTGMQVVWIRIDLTKPHLRRRHLSQSLDLQTVRVFRGYYYDGLTDAQKAELKKDIRSRFKLLETPVEDGTIDEAINDFTQPYDKKRIDPFNPRVESAIVAFLERHFSLIYIIDGLDKLDSEKDFQKKIEETQDIILGWEKRQHVYLIVMRTRSHVDLIKAYIHKAEQENLSALRKEAKTFYIVPPDLQDMVDKRLEWLWTKWESILEEEKDSIAEHHVGETVDPKKTVDNIFQSSKWISQDTIKAFHNIFLVFIYRGLTSKEYDDTITDWSPQETYSQLRNLGGDNFRILFDILMRSFRRFVETLQLLGKHPKDLIEVNHFLMEGRQALGSNSTVDVGVNARSILRDVTRKHYRVVETLTQNTESGRLRPEYGLDKETGEPFAIRDGENTEGSYIPNVFRVSNVKGVKGQQLLLLIKVRILQYLQVSKEVPTRERIMDFLGTQFGYRRKNIDLDLTDLEKESLIGQIVKWPNGVGSPAVSYQITPVGENIINNSISDFNYLAMVASDALVPDEICERFYVLDDHDIDKDWFMWNISRIPVVMNFITLLVELEEKERDIYRESESDIKVEAFDIGPKITARVKQVVEKIIGTAMATGRDVKSIRNILARCDVLK